ncbi:MAG TPA: heparinase II/III family protein, partial [Armatimonadota bacterium]|nr:heparinase II/III family protein [Armatimonadota bacterium]
MATRLLAGAVSALYLITPGLCAAEGDEAADVLAGLRPEHPRIMLTDERLAELKARAAEDSPLRRYVDDVLTAANGLLEADELRHVLPDGIRLLSVSRACLSRVSTLALAYRWTSNERYLSAALRDLRSVCAFKDWNPDHFLDTAEMTHAVAIGYDWLYAALDDETRQILRAAILHLGLEPGLRGYRGEKYSFPRAENNWNQVCNSGLTVGALAVADTDPDVAREIIACAIASLPTAMRHYAPDGAWMEGPGYWDYATSYICYGIAALDSALGRDLGTSEYPGLADSGYFPIYGAGPTGCYLSYADAGMMSRATPKACLFFLAGKFGRPEFADAEHAILRDQTASAFHVVWYQPPSGQTFERDLDRLFRGPVEVAFLRSAWGDPSALWVGAKAGYNQVPHGHLDLGNFELDALGVRWAIDLGADDYNLPGYWSGREDGQRWTYYRLNSQSHNVCTIDGNNQLVNARAQIVRWQSRPESGAVVIDLTNAYAHVERAMRGVQLLRREGAILIQDEFTLAGPRNLVWGMTTRAEITVDDDGSARLAQDGQQLRVRVLEPAGAGFEEGSAQRDRPEAENKGFRRLLLPLRNATGDQRIALLFVPVTADAQGEPRLTIVPLADWSGDAANDP